MDRAHLSTIINDTQPYEGGWHEIIRFVSRSDSPDAIFALLLDAVDVTRSEEAWGALAVTILEPLLDLHWQTILDRFVAAAEKSPALRRVLRASDYDVPPEVEQRLEPLRQSGSQDS